MKAESNDKKEFVLPVKSTIQAEKSGQNLFFESGGEFALPDYMPKVEKLLRTESKVLPPSRYVSSNEVIMSGNVLHSLIYVGDEGEVSATVLPTKYEVSIPFASNGEESEIFAQPILENANCRVSAPRRVNIRTKLRAKPCIISKTDIAPELPEDTSVIHMLWGEASHVETNVLRAENITVSENMEINAPSEARLIWCGANAAVTDVRVTESGVQVRGEVLVKVLSTLGADTKMHKKKIRFEEFIDGEFSRKSAVSAVAKVISTEAGREDGKDALVDIVISLELVADTPCTTDVVIDAFSDKVNAPVEYSQLPTSKLVMSRCGVYSASGSISKGAFVNLLEILDTSGEAVIEETKKEKGKLWMIGRCNLHSIYKTVDGGYSSAEYSLPFKLFWEADSNSEVDTNVQASLLSVKTRTDGENIACDMEVFASVRAFEKGEMRVLRSIDTDKAKDYKKNEYPLCLIYPLGESLWSLAKKYHVSPEKLAKINSLSISEDEYTSVEALSKTKILMLQI